MSYCQIGDTSTVYYSFSGGTWQNVTFHLAPIDVRVDIEKGTDKKDDDSSSGVGPCPKMEGQNCLLIYSASLRFGDSGELEIGQCNSYVADGFFFEECYESFMFEGNENYEFKYSDFGFIFKVTARCFYTYQKSVPRPGPPTRYIDLVNDGNGLLVSGWSPSDSCFPEGGDPENCYDSANPPPPPKDKKKEPRAIITVFYNGLSIWQAQGKPPCTYAVSCKSDECPPEFMKLPSTTNPKKFCCTPCVELKSEVSQIKALLRQKYG